ncbi:MAG: hypothetical protein AAFR83_22115 [Cyanobacteria bacterium J06629_18]
MKNFLSFLSTTFSGLAFVATIFLISQILEVKKSVDSLSESVTANSQELKTIAVSNNTATNNSTPIISTENKSLEQQTPEPADETNLNPIQNQTSSESIEPGQFVNVGYNNQLKIEILSAKRIENPKTGKKDIVNFNLRVKRQVAEAQGYLSLSRVKGRNPETSEDYRTVTNKSTSTTRIRRLPDNAWANGYFWLKVPENVNSVDIVIPQTAIFKQVPISD